MADDGEAGGVNARLVVSLQADLTQLRRAFDQAGKAADGALLGIEQRSRRTQERLRENLELIRMNQQLDLARAAGNSKVVAKLSEEIALRTTINKLIAAGVAKTEAQAMAEAHLGALEKAKSGREGVFGALAYSFDRSRLAVLEEGGAKVGIFGGALEKLGGAGLVAAGGLAAFGIAAEEARKALEFADDIANVARRLHVTTDELQEFRFAIQEVGGATSGADEALESFSAMLGKAQAGMPRAMRAFKELGFTPEEVKSFKTVEEGLDAVTEKIGGLRSNVQKDAVIEQLGLTGLKPLIEAGAEKMRELREEAQKTGQVMDSGLIKSGAELNKEFDKITRQVGVELKEAFVSLGPVLIGLAKTIAAMAGAISDLIQQFKPIEQRSVNVLQARRDDTQKQLNILLAAQGRGQQESPVAIANLRGQLAQYDAALKTRKGAAEVPAIPTGGADLIDQTKTPKGRTKTDETASSAKTIGDSLAEAQKRLTEAMAALTGDVLRHADLEKKAVDEEYGKQLLDLKAALDKLDKGVADGTINPRAAEQQRLQIAQTGLAEMATAMARKRNIDIGAQIALEQKSLDKAKAVAGFDDQVLGVALALAHTRQERLALELQQLADQKALADRERKDKRDAAALRNAPGDGEIVVSVDTEQRAADRAYGAKRQQIQQQNLSPWEQWQKDGQTAFENIGDTIQNEAVKQISQFNDGLASAISHGKSLKDVMHNVFQSMEEDLIKLALSQGEHALFGGAMASLAHFLPGFAGGTDHAPGGPAIVGEKGREVVNLPKGSTVTPLSKVPSLTSIGTPAARQSVVNQAIHLHMEGALMTDEFAGSILRQASQQSASYAQQAGAAAYAGAQRAAPGWAAQQQYEQG